MKLEWGDQIDLEICQSSQTKIQLRCSDQSIPMTENLVYRAAQEFSKAIPVYFEANIFVKKKIPTQTGLGGGSSDAAQILLLLKDWYLKRIGKHPKIDQKINQVAEGLGSDISFFLNTATNAGWCSGRGEKVEALNLESRPAILVFPQDKVSTKDAYRWLDEARKGRKLPQEHLAKPKWIKFFDRCRVPPIFNDFQSPVFAERPGIFGALNELSRTEAISGGMSGSGSCVFGFYSDEEAQGRAHFELAKKSLAPVSTRIEVPSRQSS